VEPAELPVTTAAYDLSVEFTEDGTGGLHGTVEYATDLFDAATAERFAAHLGVLLDAVAADASVPVADLPVLPAGERERLLTGWQPAPLTVPAHTYPQAFEAQARRTPRARALVAGDTTYDFAALDARANRLARHLAGLGAGPERVVAVRLPRSADTVVAQLAVLKAGATFLSVDPALPAERIAWLLADSAAAVVLDEALLATVPFDAPDPAADADLTDADRTAPLTPECAAYLNYT
jgi:non-ribosomal peptide synthetase component F